VTGFLFDQRPIPLAKEPRIEPSPAEAARPQFGPDVARVIEHKRGPFRRVLEGSVVDEFRILELRNGAIVEETVAGLRRSSTVTRDLIASSLQGGLWREMPR
jgi:hypothetical protein